MDSEFISGERKDFIDLLKDLNLKHINKNDAICLTYLAKNNDVKSRELEANLSLRQPEVSIAVQNLRDLGWVEKDKLKKEGKGRPTQVYNLRGF